jgi:hypothetical protein
MSSSTFVTSFGIGCAGRSGSATDTAGSVDHAAFERPAQHCRHDPAVLGAILDLRRHRTAATMRR